MRGGTKLEAVPIQSYGFKYGGNESEEALLISQHASEQQNIFNNTLSGGSRIKRGGSSVIEIPQFPQVGLSVSPQTANTAAFAINKVLIESTNNAMNDSLVGKPASLQLGGKKYKTNKSIKTRITKNRKIIKSKHNKKCNCLRCKKSKKSKLIKQKYSRKYKSRK